MESKVIKVYSEKLDLKLNEEESTFFLNFLREIDTIWHDDSISSIHNSDFDLIDKLRSILIEFKERYNISRK